MPYPYAISVGEVPWSISIFTGHQLHPVVGFFKGGTQKSTLCIKHAGRYRPYNRGQLMTQADAIYEHIDPMHPDLWCLECAKQHAWPGHEYLVQKKSVIFEVLDLTADLDGKVGASVYCGSYEQCQKWIDEARESDHYVVMI